MLNSDTQSSEFFSIAKTADILSTSTIKVTRTELAIENADLYASVIGKKSQAIEMCSSIGIDNASVVVLSTAEAEAVGGAGLFTNNSNFRLPRFHIGPAAQLDMSVAIAQLARTTIMSQVIEDSSPDNAGIIQFSREGHLANWQVAVWLASGKNLPTTLVKISHQKSDNHYTRIAHIDGELNLEGFPSKLKRLYICDPIASGMQHVAMIEYLEKIKRLPREIVVIASMSTLFGLQVIALACAKRGISFKAGVLGTLLDSKPPLRYFSPYPQKIDQIANKTLGQFMQQQFGEILHSWCIRCNWTASFMGGITLPHTASEAELRELGLSDKKLDDMQRQITLDQAKNAGISNYLIPYSTRLSQK